ncbi:hypothetical protein [Nonomuraea cavernae]|uniref:HicB family protein n=1 Tax=Nonomuraea cavernae TaxID=2045107 RepID=A0A917YUJ5_9ACTN|nr:hypothetical protein [Nonomuraea cavernae]MCA2185411.1 hypothetical protein [Nonomuraea cavernae]GGO66384.1 hypothetical protein GCM10012289_20280 [Nonomuraea cavernae]
MTQQISVIIDVTRQDGYWNGIPRDTPGSGAGRTLAELEEELSAIMPLMLGCEPDEVELVYNYTGLPQEVRQDLERFRTLREQRDQIEESLRKIGSRVATRLKKEKVTDEDTGRLLGGLSRQRVGQLRAG